MCLSVAAPPARHGRSVGLRFSHRFHPLRVQGEAPPAARLDISILLDDVARLRDGARAGLQAGTRFLIDAVLGVVEPVELAHMIGCFVFACVAGERHQVADVTLRSGGGPVAAARMTRRAFEVERNGFGAAHILHESGTLGLYVLEVAPGALIPAHFHRLMQETELVLDPGLLQQAAPVRPGDAFVWPAGWVHEYRNPTGLPRRILCVDRPKFIPEDEVVVAGPAELLRRQPARSYLA